MPVAESTKGRPGPRRTVHRGVVAAVGVWFADGSLTKGEVVRRIAAGWKPGCSVARAGGGLLLELDAPRLVDSRGSPGLVLSLAQGVAASAPLEPTELPPNATPGDWVIVEAGHARRVTRAELDAVDPSDWLDVSAFELESVVPLGAVEEAPPAIVAGPSSAEIFDARVGRRPEHHAEQSEVLEALAALRAGTGAPPRASNGWLVRLHAWLLRVAARRRKSTARPSATQSQAIEPHGAARESWLERFNQWLERLLLRSWLGDRLARRHADYLRRLFELLEAQRDLEALKYAIPLSRGGGESKQALQAPSPRSDLEISLVKSGVTSSIFVAGDLFAELRTRYEAIFERLDAAGRIEDAAFVLAELFDDAARAVAYLERHGRLRLAAELAEARKLEPALVVRQWFLADERERAIAIAARHGVFIEAIERLVRSGHPDEASALRFHYADRLASAGKFVAAAELMMSMSKGHPLALRWLEAAREAGDLRGIALELEHAADRFGLVWKSVEPLLAETTSDASRERNALVKTLLERSVAVTRPIARELARKLYADAASSGDTATGLLARRVATFIGGAFQADAPTVLGFEQRLPEKPVTLSFARSDIGKNPVLDLARVGSRLVLAHGEGGVRLCDRRGRELAHFDVPAERLVAAPDCPHVLAVARRGDVVRVSRIHLGLRRSEAVTELRARAFAPSFDGERWFVAEDDDWLRQRAPRLLLLDMVSEKPTVLERIPLPEADIGALDANDRAVSVLAFYPGASPEVLRYELPSITLRERSVVFKESPDDDEKEPKVFVGPVSVAASEPPTVFEAWLNPETMKLPDSELRRGSQSVPLGPEVALALDLERTNAVALEARDGWFALALSNERGARVFAGSFSAGRVTLDLELLGAAEARVRIAPPFLLVGDPVGRALVYDLEASRLVSDLRV